MNISRPPRNGPYKNNKGDAWKDWWYGDKAKDVTYWEFMGKDNVPFHTVGFPVTIMASGEPWKLVDRLKGFNWLNYDGGKFSTSGKRGIFMDTALDVASADWWRYYLIANAPESSDSNFTWEHFAGVINKDLADVLGNFVNRVTKFCVARFDGQVPGEGEYGEEEKALIADLDRRIAQYAQFMETAEFRKALGELRAIWVAGNEYLTKAAPWTHIKTDRAKAAVGVRMRVEPGAPIRTFDLAGDAVPSPGRSAECIQPVGYRAGVIPFPDVLDGGSAGRTDAGANHQGAGGAGRQDQRRAGGGVEGAIWWGFAVTHHVMAGPDPAIHLTAARWMAASRAAMTWEELVAVWLRAANIIIVLP